jgi:hypothetical protein
MRSPGFAVSSAAAEQRREGAARVAEAAEQRVDDRASVEAQRAHRAPVGALVGRVERDAREVRALRARPLEQPPYRLDEARLVALLQDEALLPAVDEAVALGAPDVDDLLGHLMEAVDRRDRVLTADEERGGAVADRALEGRAGRGQAAVARDDEHAPRRAGGHRVERAPQRVEAGAQRAAEVRGADVAAQVESLREERRTLLLAEGIRRRREEHAVDRTAVEAAQAVHRGRHGHGDGVLVVPGDRLLGAAVLRGPPADRREREPRRRDVGAPRDDPGAHSFSSFTPP